MFQLMTVCKKQTHLRAGHEGPWRGGRKKLGTWWGRVVSSTTGRLCPQALTRKVAQLLMCAAFLIQGKQCNNQLSMKAVFHGLMSKVAQVWHCLVDTYHEPSPESIGFYLYTRRNADNPEKLTAPVSCARSDLLKELNDKCSVPCSEKKRFADGFVRLKRSGEVQSEFFNTRAATKVLIHGFGESSAANDMSKMKKAYLTVGDYNVLVVDWGRLAASPCYTTAKRNTNVVGRALGNLLDQLATSGADLGRVHLIGYSLGAQVAGIAGNAVLRGAVCRITGLDPALPLFRGMAMHDKLDAGDATFVDVIHTGGGLLGMAERVGHADFFPNGGRRQPGCALADLFCSHTRAPYYFAESITSPVGFNATRCESWKEFHRGRCNSTETMLMGEPCTTSAQGSYFLRTNQTEPYALG